MEREIFWTEFFLENFYWLAKTAGEIVNYRYRVVFFQKKFNGVRTDITSASGDQNFHLVSPERIERSTPCLKGKCSTTELRALEKCIFQG